VSKPDFYTDVIPVIKKTHVLLKVVGMGWNFYEYLGWNLLGQVSVNWTPIFELYMTKFLEQNKHQKDMCYNEIELNA
jgi:hypothetical protein